MYPSEQLELVMDINELTASTVGSTAPPVAPGYAPPSAETVLMPYQGGGMGTVLLEDAPEPPAGAPPEHVIGLDELAEMVEQSTHNTVLG